MTKPLIAVFAGAHAPKGKDGELIQKQAKKLGNAIGDAGFDILYGGGSLGLMGAVTNAAYDFGAQVYAVLLERFAKDKEATPAKIVGVVKTEYERFPLFMAQNPAAFLVLPGGSGTHREAWQGIEEAIYNQGPPVVLVGSGKNLKGIVKDFNAAVKTGLIKPEFKNVLRTWNPDGKKKLRDVLDMPDPKLASPAKPKQKELAPVA